MKDETRRSFVVESPDGRRFIRPDNDCYACDVRGPGCMWHKADWVEEPEVP